MTLRRCRLYIPFLLAFALLQTFSQPANAQNTAGKSTTSATLSNTAALPQFDVATIKPSNPDVPHMMGVNVYPGGRVAINALDLKALIAVAFDIHYWQISGGEEWTGKDVYDVVAEPPEDVRSTTLDMRHSLFTIEDKGLRRMLQALLIERFQLEFHRESKNGKVYLLERTNKTLKLQPSRSGSGFSSIGFAEKWVVDNTTMPQLASFTSAAILHCTVLDQTGISGAFDYKSPPEDWETYQQNQTASFLFLIQEMGLRLKPSRGPVETFVIDHAERPSPN